MFVRHISIIVAVLASLRLSAQEVHSIPQSAEAPREAFLENAPLAEFGFDEALFNAKEQRLRDHTLETPLGPAPAVDPREAAIQPRETQINEHKFRRDLCSLWTVWR